MKNAGMHRLAPFMFGLFHVFLAVFSRHGLSTASPRPLQAQSRACSFPVHFRAALLCAGENGRFVSGSYRDKLLLHVVLDFGQVAHGLVVVCGFQLSAHSLASV